LPIISCSFGRDRIPFDARANGQIILLSQLVSSCPFERFDLLEDDFSLRLIDD